MTLKTLADYPTLMLRGEVAELLRVSTSTLCRWARSGNGPRCIFLDEGLPRYRKEDIISYLER